MEQMFVLQTSTTVCSETNLRFGELKLGRELGALRNG